MRTQRHRRQLLRSLLLICACLSHVAAKHHPQTSAPESAIGLRMDYGPFLSSSVQRPAPAGLTHGAADQLVAAKGVTIKVGNNASVCFDTDSLRIAAGWSGGFLELSRTHLGALKGDSPAGVAGAVQFSTRQGPGWAQAGSFVDPRPGGFGPLPTAWAHYKGLYRHGEQVVLSYSIAGTDVLDLPGSYVAEGHLIFTRTIRIGISPRPMTLLVCDGPGATGGVAPLATMSGSAPAEHAEDSTALLRGPNGAIAIGVLGAPRGAMLRIIDENRVVLELPPIGAPLAFKVVIAAAPAEQIARFPLWLRSAPPVAVLSALCKGGPALWKGPLVTQGRRAADDRPYIVDSVTLPENNPWNSWMRPTALDFFSDGRCALATLNGDVWIVSGIDADLRHVTWKRFAAGLYEPLGLKIVDDQVYVLGRDQITRLHDLSNSGEADFYEDFNNGGATSPIYHAFTFDLQRDSHGDFYYSVDGNAVPLNVPMHGCILKVSKDGSRTQVYATGLRAANGSGLGPHDELVCSDNQGNWTPVCRINLVREGGFYGFNGDPHVVTKADIAHERKTYDPPLCWIPYEKDNSTGGQVFVSGGKWGPLEGHMLSTSYGKCRLFEVMCECVDGVAQGATVELPLAFSSGIMRARFNPADGQLYVCGMKGWQTSANKDGCLERVRYTGKAVCLPDQIHVHKSGIEISFTCPLDPTAAGDEQNYGIEQWNYRWSSAYGSNKYKLSDPMQVGTDEVEVKSARLLPDHKTVFLEVPNLRPVMQMAIQVRISAADGTPIECEIDQTINRVPGSSPPPVLSAP